MTNVCDGMEYLQSKKLIHRDLAASNILVSDNDVAEVSDFGLTRVSANQHAKLPVRWSAPEALWKENYSTKTDVWSSSMGNLLLWSSTIPKDVYK
ncbi:tyrosine-protein kinase CSK-like [Corythoichthys intestinalis]|uniref:tyrosine-protein kinase CSK-like n=1 Tax=Corythoichthys intestinalis TaxID=161448 RepID=UPI0025A68B0C|nr:tyrosine-protein kinase CSK-like [Corythoichthys intestinalis]